jgi:hypothetical protein
MPRDERNSIFEASFGFDMFLCQLFRQIDPVSELNRELRRNEHLLNRMAVAARRMSDGWTLRFLSEDQRMATRGVLFHERVHYWQLLSASGLQRQTMNALAHLQEAIKADGGRPLTVWAGVPGSDTVLQDAYFLYENFNWEGTNVFSDYERFEFRGGLPTILRRVQLGLDSETAIEAFVAELGFGSDNSDVVIVPLVGRFLVESAAHVAEALFKGEKLPRMTESGAPEDVLYNGAWELWCRVNGGRYEDPESLAIAFLAAVDLAINPELSLGPEPETREITIPWRFGAILLTVLSLPPLKADSGSEAVALEDFQKQVCQALGWRTPLDVAFEMAASLTKLYAPLLGLHRNQEKIQTFHERPLRELGIDDVVPIWKLINENSEPDLIGLSVMRSMINASVFRVLDPGKLALPHLHAEELCAAFPLPAILYDGEFYFDGRFERKDVVLNVDVVKYWSDCVRLMTIDHLRLVPASESLSCGFVRRNLECPYMAAGAGCPKRGLSPVEELTRQHAGLDPDWCHWKISAIAVGLIPPDENKKAASALFDAVPTSISLSSTEDMEKMLGVARTQWQRMTEEERKQALAATTEMEKNLSEEDRANYVNLWAIIASTSSGGSGA